MDSQPPVSDEEQLEEEQQEDSVVGPTKETT